MSEDLRWFSPPPPPTLRFVDVGHSASAKKTLEKHRVGSLDAAEAAVAAEQDAASSAGGGGAALYVLAALALAAALAYQFLYVPRAAGGA